MSHSHTLQNITQMIGIQSTIKLVRSKGGQALFFPSVHSLHDFHWLVVTVGMENAQKLCVELQGQTITLPIEVNALLQLRNQSVISDFKIGKSKSYIARKHQVSRKLIQVILKNAGA